MKVLKLVFPRTGKRGWVSWRLGCVPALCSHNCGKMFSSSFMAFQKWCVCLICGMWKHMVFICVIIVPSASAHGSWFLWARRCTKTEHMDCFCHKDQFKVMSTLLFELLGQCYGSCPFPAAHAALPVDGIFLPPPELHVTDKWKNALCCHKTTFCWQGDVHTWSFASRATLDFWG